MMAARIRAAPTREPTTIPAMAPPESPEPDLFPPDPTEVEVGDAELVEEGNKGGMDVVVGNFTPSQRFSTLAFTQQESVELGELSAQNEHKPGRLDWYPHSAGSLSDAAMQEPLSARAGSEHVMKSDLIWDIAFGPEFPHKSGLAIIFCSLMAN